MKKLVGILFLLVCFVLLTQGGLQASASAMFPPCSSVCGGIPSVSYCDWTGSPPWTSLESQQCSWNGDRTCGSYWTILCTS